MPRIVPLVVYALLGTSRAIGRRPRGHGLSAGGLWPGGLGGGRDRSGTSSSPCCLAFMTGGVFQLTLGLLRMGFLAQLPLPACHQRFYQRRRPHHRPETNCPSILGIEAGTERPPAPPRVWRPMRLVPWAKPTCRGHADAGMCAVSLALLLGLQPLGTAESPAPSQWLWCLGILLVPWSLAISKLCAFKWWASVPSRTARVPHALPVIWWQTLNCCSARWPPPSRFDRLHGGLSAWPLPFPRKKGGFRRGIGQPGAPRSGYAANYAGRAGLAPTPPLAASPGLGGQRPRAGARTGMSALISAASRGPRPHLSRCPPLPRAARGRPRGHHRRGGFRAWWTCAIPRHLWFTHTARRPSSSFATFCP